MLEREIHKNVTKRAPNFPPPKRKRVILSPKMCPSLPRNLRKIGCSIDNQGGPGLHHKAVDRTEHRYCSVPSAIPARDAQNHPRVWKAKLACGFFCIPSCEVEDITAAYTGGGIKHKPILLQLS